MKIEHDQSDITRFMTFVDKLPNGCWFWAGARSRGKGNRKWYGSFTVKGRTVRAHAFSCDVIGRKPKPDDGQIWHRDHECCFSLCVNFDHIDWQTHARNQELKIHRQKERTSHATA